MGLSPLTAAQGLHMPESGCEYEDSRRRHAVEVPWPRINANGEVRPPQCITSTGNLCRSWSVCSTSVAVKRGFL